MRRRTGKNNAGKTSLLEAIFLHSGPSSHARQFFDFLRMLERFSIHDQEHWEWLFHNRKLDVPIKLSSVAGGSARELLVRLVEPESFTLAKDKPGIRLADFGGQFELHLDYRETHADGETTENYIVTSSGGTALHAKSTTKSSIPSVPWAHVGASALQSPDDTERFGQLEKIGREREVVAVLQLLEDRLSRLALIVSRGEPALHGEIGVGYMVPIHLMSEGIRRLLSIVLAIATCPGGIWLIDEIENGFHYSVVKEVWKAIARAARKANVQVFATTHSWECPVKAHEAFAADCLYDLRWHRIQEVRGETQVISHDREMIETALYCGVEIR